MQLMKLVTSDLVNNLGSASTLTKTTNQDRIWQGSELGEHSKNFMTLVMMMMQQLQKW